jgi:hypothetical protein
VTRVTSARTGDPIPWFKFIRGTNGLDHYAGGTVAERFWLTETRHYFLVGGNHTLSLYILQHLSHQIRPAAGLPE